MEQPCNEEENNLIREKGEKCALTVLPIDPLKSLFPLCIVWTPLPIISWLVPYVGHVGICREDGTILDFAGSYFVNIDNFAFGAPARYARLSLEKCCIPRNLSSHTCKSGYSHAELGTANSWDDSLGICMSSFQHKSHNLFTCNCHSFVAACLNRLAYQGLFEWNIISVVILIFLKGQWVNKCAMIRSFGPFLVVLLIGIHIGGWSFFVGWAAFSFLLIAWFAIGSYLIKHLIEC